MNKRFWVGGVSFLCAGAVALGGYWLGRAGAAGIAATKAMTYSGLLTDAAGVPLNGSKNIQVQFWDAATAGNMACTVGPSPLTLVGGGFQLGLPDTCTAAVQATPELWAEVFVDGGSLGRSKLSSVPYAIEAARAADASGALKTRLETLETGTAKLAGDQTIAGTKTFSSPIAAKVACPTGMVDSNAGFCVDSADRAEASYFSSVTVCASEGKLVCSFNQLCFLKLARSDLKLGTAYRVSDLMFFPADGAHYLGGSSGGNGLTLPSGACGDMVAPGPHGGTLAYRCCRTKG